MNTTENNQLIADFMGVVFYDDQNKYYDSVQGLFIGRSLKYHESWDWLMPVVSKIFTLSFREVKGLRERSNEERGLFNPNGCGLHSTIEKVYKEVIEFINWYNQQQNN